MLRLTAVRKEYVAASKQAAPTVAVKDLHLQVEKGEFLTLLGPSGCGKTTTLRLIAGFETPTAGTIVLADRDITRVPPQRRGIGMVFQNYALFPHLDVAENVAFGLRTRGTSKQTITERVTAVLKRVDLAGYEKRRVQELSGGQQQRVALARALAPEPPLLLLDEPLSNLDAALRERTRTEMRLLLKRLGITAIFVTHDQEEAFALSDRIALMEGGELQQLGTPEELYNRPANSFVASFLGRANFLPARVIGMVDDALTLEVAGRATWRGCRSASLIDVATRDRVLVLARPEQLRMTRIEAGAADDPHGLDGIVVERRFAGGVTHYRVQTFGSDVVAMERDEQFEPGTRVRLRPVADLYAFPDRRSGAPRPAGQ